MPRSMSKGGSDAHGTRERQTEPCRSGNTHGQRAATVLAPGGDHPRSGSREGAGSENPGGDLALYRSDRGEPGLVQQRCPHRSASLAYGIPDEDGLRCPYHGWYFNKAGQCLAQPYDDTENPASTFKDKITITAYPVEEMGGLVWAYMGLPEQMPLLPRWEGFVREGVHKSIGVTHLPCNWLQCMENSLDPVHFEWLHANLMNFLAKKKGEPPVMKPTRHVKIAFEVFEYGIYKRRLLEGDDPETSPDWLVGHPVLFPNILAFKSKSGGNFQIRVPIDDTHTWHLMYNTRLPQNGEELTLSVYDLPWQHEQPAVSGHGHWHRHDGLDHAGAADTT